MTVSIEWYLADNFMMNYLVMLLAQTMLGTRAKRRYIVLASLFGAGYALAAAAVFPVLLRWLPKLLLGCVMALPLKSDWRAYGKAILCVYLSSFLMGGLSLGLTLLFGGSMASGVLLGAVPVRIALASAFLCALLPRIVLSLLHAMRARPFKTRVELSMSDRILQLEALVDSGNLLREPLTGKSVIVVKRGLLQTKGGLPVSYQTINGSGVIYAVKPKWVRVYDGGWRDVDALIAEADTTLFHSDAILPALLMSNQGGHAYEHDSGTDHKMVSRADQGAVWGNLLCALKRGIARAVSAGRGAGLDCQALLRRKERQGRVD